MSLLAEDKITSVQSAQEESLPSIVDPPTPPLSEPIRHVGAQNKLDPVLYMQNKHSGSFTWSVNDPRGKLLFYKPIHPKTINPIISHISETYHYWAGDVLFEFKFGGTALQSGQVDIVELPPGVHPTSLAGTNDYMAYNWVGVDAKHQGMVGIEVRDVRQGAFHHMDQKQDKFTENEVGGWVAVFVGIPLNTTSTGTQQIAAQVYAKPAPNFRMLKLKVPTNEEASGSTAGDDLMHVLAWNTKPDMLRPVDASNFQSIEKVVLGSNTIKIWDTLCPNHYDLQGQRWKMVEKFRATRHGVMEVLISSWRKSGDDNKDITAMGTPAEMVGIHSDSSVVLISSPDGKIVYHTVQVGLDKLRNTVTLKFNVKDQVAGDPENWKEKRAYIWANPLVASSWITDVESEQLKLPTDEGFVYFTNVDSKCKSLQTLEMARLFSTGRFRSWIPEGLCAHFTVMDTTDNLPVSSFKLWKEGFLTCPPKKDEIDYDIGGIKLVFTGFIPRTSPPFRSPEMARNALLIQAARSSKH